MHRVRAVVLLLVTEFVACLVPLPVSLPSLLRVWFVCMFLYRVCCVYGSSVCSLSRYSTFLVMSLLDSGILVLAGMLYSLVSPSCLVPCESCVSWASFLVFLVALLDASPRVPEFPPKWLQYLFSPPLCRLPQFSQLSVPVLLLQCVLYFSGVLSPCWSRPFYSSWLCTFSFPSSCQLLCCPF